MGTTCVVSFILYFCLFNYNLPPTVYAICMHSIVQNRQDNKEVLTALTVALLVCLCFLGKYSQ